MRNHITNSVSTCVTCQQNKRRNRKFGLLPEKVAEAQPWNRMCIDLIGPYIICRKGQEDLTCKCVTMIDPVTGWLEIHQYGDKRAITVANIAEEEWFSQYPWPTQVTFDRGTEFIGQEFQKMLDDFGVKKKPIQNATCKLMQKLNMSTKLLETSFEPLSSKMIIWTKTIIGKES
jgi:transposase InsO family protein